MAAQNPNRVEGVSRHECRAVREHLRAGGAGDGGVRAMAVQVPHARGRAKRGVSAPHHRHARRGLSAECQVDQRELMRAKAQA
eukprot:5403290-Prymnesium_polylepis.4